MIPSIFYHDGYKSDHRNQYPAGVTQVYSNFTPRISRIDGIHHVVVFGIQYFVQEFLINRFQQTFFQVEKNTVIEQYQAIMDLYLGPKSITTEHLSALHALGYLPIHVKALPEGSLCPLRVPCLTITNTHPDFAWLPNFLESLLSNVLWHPMTSATIAREYRLILEGYAFVSSDIPEFVQWQGHDFSMRGQTSFESSLVNGAAHLTSFYGTDTVPAILWIKEHYQGVGMVGSVHATEHSVMCLGGKEDEKETFHRLLTETYPTGIVSIVSDTWDYWRTLTETVAELKEVILSRSGKLVIRPDSGDPLAIICGDAEATQGSPAYRGTLEILWEIFGGTINSKGYKQLDPHIGVIYGDSITLERCETICAYMTRAGFASTNVVFGIGSYTYQYVTRDTFGFAMKATYGVVNGVGMEMCKDPLTDGGVKKSAQGLLKVDINEYGDYRLQECVSEEEEKGGALQTVFIDGYSQNEVNFETIRTRVGGPPRS